MTDSIFKQLGDQLQRARHGRKLTQPELARRVGRNRARISELERDLLDERLGRDRLTLFAEICDALGLVPVLVPAAQAMSVRESLSQPRHPPMRPGARPSSFKDVFIDLGDEDEEA